MIETIENPYMTFIAKNEDATPSEVAYAYFADFLELLGVEKAVEAAEVLMKAETRYRMLVDCFYDEGDVTLEELRGFVDGVATMVDFPQSEREWLHDAFEWVKA